MFENFDYTAWINIVMWLGLMWVIIGKLWHSKWAEEKDSEVVKNV